MHVTQQVVGELPPVEARLAALSRSAFTAGLRNSEVLSSD